MTEQINPVELAVLVEKISSGVYNAVSEKDAVLFSALSQRPTDCRLWIPCITEGNNNVCPEYLHIP
jgi:hypothetical protein